LPFANNPSFNRLLKNLSLCPLLIPFVVCRWGKEFNRQDDKASEVHALQWITLSLSFIERNNTVRNEHFGGNCDFMTPHHTGIPLFELLYLSLP
jgi:hypothetical protein